MKKNLLILTIVSFQFFCATANYNTVMVKAEDYLYKEKKPLEASRVLIPMINKKDQDQLLFMMEAGYMLHMAGKYQKSNDILLAADKKADALYKSISKEIASYITNETGKDYIGEDYERILLNMTLGLNYLMLNDFENAQVEFKKVNNKLEYIKEKSGKDYKLNLMALYLSAIAHAETGEYEYAYVELKKINDVHPGIPAVGLKLLILSKQLGYDDDYLHWTRKYNSKTLLSGLKPYKNSSELIVVFEDGLSPRKESRGKLLDDPELKTLFNAAVHTAIITSRGASRAISNELVLSTVKTAEHPIPRYVMENYDITSARLELFKDGRLIAKLTPIILNDVENTITSNFEEHYNGIKEKMLARLATKVVATLVSKTIAEEGARHMGGGRYGGLAGLLVGTLTGVGVGAALFSSEKPDLRCWHSIPANYQSATLLVPEGTYSGKIYFLDKNGKSVKEENLDNISIQSNKPSILLFRTVD